MSKCHRKDSQSDDSRSRSNSRTGHKNNHGSPKTNQDHDSVSIYIGNIDYNATEEELRETFINCGDIVRVTIIKNMKTGHPKGAAFIEFTDKHGVEAAMNLDGKQVRGRPLIVTTKKPRPENRYREARSSYYERSSYDRRPSTRTGPMYSSYQNSRQYSTASRNGYHPDPREIYDDRRPPSHIQMQMEQMHMQRYDPYRRPDYYDPYVTGSRNSDMHLSNYYNNSRNDQRKMNEIRGYRDHREMRQDFRFDPRAVPNQNRFNSRGDMKNDQRNYRENKSAMPSQRSSNSYRH